MTDSMGEKFRNFVDDNTHHQTDDELPRQFAEGETFIQSVALPAFEEVRQIIERDGNKVTITDNQTNAMLKVVRDGQEIFTYTIRMQLTDRGAFPLYQARGINGRLNTANEGHLRPDTTENQSYNATSITRDELVRHVLNAYQVEAALEK